LSEAVKLSYRAIGGFLVLFLLFIAMIIGLIFGLLGIIISLLFWFPLLDPEILVTYRIYFLNTRIVDPSTAAILLLSTGITLFSTGAIIIGSANYFYKTAVILDQDLTQLVDTTLPSLKLFTKRKAKGIFILIILLFGTFFVFFALFL